MSRAGLPGLLRRARAGTTRCEPSTHEAHSDAEADGRGRRDGRRRPASRRRGRRGPSTTRIHPHESPWTMTVPLVVLAVLAAIAGFLNLPFTDSTKFLENWLEPVTGRYGAVGRLLATARSSLLLADLDGRRAHRHRHRLPRLPPHASSRPTCSSSRSSCTAGTSTGPSAAFVGGPGRSAADAPSPGSTARSSTARSTASARSPATRAASSAAARPATCAPTRSRVDDRRRPARRSSS